MSWEEHLESAHIILFCENVIELIYFSFRARFMQFATPQHLQRFLERCKQLMQSTVEEAKLRQRGEVLSLEAYIPLRRLNVGVYVCFAFTEAVLGVNLSDEVYNDPVFSRLYDTATDLVWWANVSPFLPKTRKQLTTGQDLYSYNMEQAKGHQGNNVITVLLQSKGMVIQTAADYAGTQFDQQVRAFVADKVTLPSWGPTIDADVAKCVHGLEHWVVGNLQFSGETDRYLSPKEKITRVVTLRKPDVEVADEASSK